MKRQVRSLLNESENARCPDEMVERYLRALGYKDIKHTAKRLKSTLLWYEKENPSSMFCSACVKDKASHYMHTVCYDIYDRPTIYSCLELATNKEIEDNRRHMISSFETAIALMGEHVSQWNWILDFHGFGITDANPRLAKIFLNLAAEHYPERLGHFFIIDAPALFRTLWQAISPFIDPKTKKKIQFLRLKDTQSLRKALEEYFSGDVIEWLVTELADNRVKRTKGEKTYDYPKMANMVLRESRCDQCTEDGVTHNHLFAPGFVAKVHALRGGVPNRIRGYVE